MDGKFQIIKKKHLCKSGLKTASHINILNISLIPKQFLHSKTLLFEDGKYLKEILTQSCEFSCLVAGDQMLPTREAISELCPLPGVQIVQLDSTELPLAFRK